MSRLTDTDYLRNDQYKDASNLEARIQLHARFSTSPQDWFGWLFDQYDFPPECGILELGCGPATMWPGLVEGLPSGWEITLSDFSPGMAAAAQETLRDHQDRFTFEVIDAQEIPFPDNSFDVVLAHMMLFHIPDRPKALAEIHRALKPGGRFLAATMGEAHLAELSELVNGFDSRISYGVNRLSDSFMLDSGRSQLEPWFDDITLRRHENNLEITEAAPLVAYLLSGMSNVGDILVGDKLTAFTQMLEDQIAAHGAIHITKDMGLFLARKPSESRE